MNQQLLSILELKENREKSKSGLNDKDHLLNKAKDLLNSYEFKIYLNKLNNSDDLSGLDLLQINDRIKILSDRLGAILEEIDLDDFIKSGKTFATDLIKKRLDQKNIYLKFPSFNWEKFKYYLEHPLLEIKNFNGDIIYYDAFVVKKLTTAVIQCLSDEMDIRYIISGEEGTGKSCLSSQILIWFYTFLYDCGLISYNFDMKKILFSSNYTMLETMDLQKNNDFLRLFVLDEGYSMNRQNYKDPTMIMYKEEMRSDRKLLRIVNINLPQLGELDLSLTLTRTNFIFDCKSDGEFKTGMLKKGVVDMYIIPRGHTVYSTYHQRDLSKSEIKNAFANTFKSKLDYYTELPQEVIIHRFKSKEIWAFNKSLYDEHIKNENKRRRLSGSVQMTELISFILYEMIEQKKMSEFFNLKNEGSTRMYRTFNKWYNAYIKNRFKNDHDKLAKFKMFYFKDQVLNEKIKEIKSRDEQPELELLNDETYGDEIEELTTDKNLIKFSEELNTPNIKTEKPKKFMADLNK